MNFKPITIAKVCGKLSVNLTANVSCQLNFRVFVSCQLILLPFASCQLTPSRPSCLPLFLDLYEVTVDSAFGPINYHLIETSSS